MPLHVFFDTASAENIVNILNSSRLIEAEGSKSRWAVNEAMMYHRKYPDNKCKEPSIYFKICLIPRWSNARKDFKCSA